MISTSGALLRQAGISAGYSFNRCRYRREESRMKEIPPPSPSPFQQYQPSSAICPNCQTSMLYGPVGCPDGRPGCCVAHYGYSCPNCHKQFA